MKVFKNKISLMFPGQGFQFVGMLNDFTTPFDEEYSMIINRFDISLQNYIEPTLSSLMTLNKTDSDELSKTKRNLLNQTKIAQPAILLQSILNYKKLLREDRFQIENLFGPSLGEVISLVIADSIDYEKGALLLYKRGEFMQESCPIGIGAMLNIIGNSDNIINHFNKFIDTVEDKSFINISSINTNRLVVVSGKVELIEQCIKYLKKNHIACKKLPVSAAFHSKLMEKGKIQFEEFLLNPKNDIKFKVPKYKILSTINTDLDYTNNSTDFDLFVKGLLVDQFIKPVNLLNCVKKNYENKIQTYDMNKRKLVDYSEYL